MSAKKIFFIFLILLGMFSCTSNKEEKKEKILIGIQPFKNVDASLADTLKVSIEKYYGFKICILPAINIPQETFVNIKTPRYRADKLIDYLLKIKPDSVNYIIGFTEKDISVTKRDGDGNVMEPKSRYNDFGIFGLGFKPGHSCIVSTFRLNSKHEKYVERIKKVCLHELGHNLGLDHCPDKNCFMRSAEESIQSVDEEKLQLCNNCFEKIR